MIPPDTATLLDVIDRTPAPPWLAGRDLPAKIAALRQHGLRGISVRLQPYERRFGESLRTLRNQPENRAKLAQTGELTAEQQQAWEDAYFARADDLCWIVLTPSGEFSGAVALYDLTTDAAETGRLVLREEIARSTPAIAECELMMQWLAFGWLGLRRVTAQIQPTNAKMVAMHERLGFVATGPSQIRGVPYTRFEVTADHFRPEPHLRVLRHWRDRPTAAR